MSDFKDLLVEWRYREHALRYLADRIRQGVVLTRAAHEQRIVNAFAASRLSLADRDDAILVDLVVEGQGVDDGQPLRLVIEVAPALTAAEVQHAHQRATLWEQLGTPVQPGVAGLTITTEAEAQARAQHVFISLVPELWEQEASAPSPSSATTPSRER